MSLRNKQLQQQIGILQHENQRLLSKSQGSESAQLAEMKEQVVCFLYFAKLMLILHLIII
jgi:hypothetical protein